MRYTEREYMRPTQKESRRHTQKRARETDTEGEHATHYEAARQHFRAMMSETGGKRSTEKA